MIEKEIVLAGANNWADALVLDFLDGSPLPATDPSRGKFVPFLIYLDAAIAGAAVLRFFFAPAAGATADNQSLMYLSQTAEAGMLLQCGEGLPVWRHLSGNFDPWTLRVTSTGKSGDGRIRAAYSYREVTP